MIIYQGIYSTTYAIWLAYANVNIISDLLVIHLSKPQKMPTDAEDQLMKDFIKQWSSVCDPFLKNIKYKI